jgi:hypothetical protein
VDLLEDRVSKTVFAGLYLKENVGEFKSRVLEGKNNLETLLFRLLPHFGGKMLQL